MLREIQDLRQIPGEPRRRWFVDPDMDLIVWLGESDEVTGFQLCYDKQQLEQALTWLPHSGYCHCLVDSGEYRPGRHKASPVLVRGGRFDRRVAEEFLRKAEALERDLIGFIYSKLTAYLWAAA